MAKKAQEQPVTIKTDKINGIDKWEVESALRTCMEYKKITGNKKLMGAVSKLAKEQVKEISSIQDLKDAYDNLPDEE